MIREIENVNFGSWLQRKRKERHLSQTQLADRVYLYQNAIGYWERGEKSPRLEDVERIVKFFGAEIVIREKVNEEP